MTMRCGFATLLKNGRFVVLSLLGNWLVPKEIICTDTAFCNRQLRSGLLAAMTSIIVSGKSMSKLFLQWACVRDVAAKNFVLEQKLINQVISAELLLPVMHGTQTVSQGFTFSFANV